jgi:predicted Zn-dependent peptidase
MSQDLHIHQLANGIVLCHRQVNNTKIAHCGFVFDIGSRDENEHQYGLAHFWEHMAFKGTQKRKSFHIINRLETVGGELNAFTTKEKVYIYASVLDKHFDRACELLTDISFRSTFPEKEIEKEKGVILEEMAMYEDSPEDAIFDEFDAVLYPSHALGMNILGTRESVKSFTKSDFESFLGQHMGQKQVVLCSVSSLPFNKVLKTVQKHLDSVTRPYLERPRIAPIAVQNQEVTRYKAIQQAHVVLGAYAPAINNPDRIPFFMMSYLLGGPQMGSRLNLNLREKHGLVYSVESNFNSYTDTGNFSVYFGTDPKNVKKANALILKELKKMREETLGTAQISKLKDQICGSLAMAEESNSSFMQMMGKSLLDVGKIESLTDVFSQINDVSAKKIRDLANQYLNEDSFSSLSYLPELKGKNKS